jgi:hypothetical protein
MRIKSSCLDRQQKVPADWDRRRLPARRTQERHHARTPASFELSIDYVVTKIPRFAFKKFPQGDPGLATQLKSVGEAMAIGLTFKESLQKWNTSRWTACIASRSFQIILTARQVGVQILPNFNPQPK